jgi:3-phenylpropionate/trans-cinnamate dioxygenase ferredoxin reductase subunit
VLGPELGAIYRDIHTDHGVTFIGGAEVEAVAGEDGKVIGVRLTGGRTVGADFVVAGIGVTPRVALAQAAGLDVDNGIVVDANLQASAAGVFAAGDVANAMHPFFGTRVRVEHWANALNQGPAAARNMLGRDTPHEELPYFFSDQYDVGMEYSGYATDWDEVVFRGDPAVREFVAFWLADDRVVAGMNVNVWDVNEHVQALIRSRAVIDRKRLTDPDVPLEDLAAAATG